MFFAGMLAGMEFVIHYGLGTIPINSATADWKLDAPPADWKAQIAHAERFHIVGVWAAVLAFACFLSAMAVKLTAMALKLAVN
jgi:hypothetical protein